MMELGLLAAPVGFDTILVKMDNDADLIGLANSLHLAVEEAVFGKGSLPLDFLLNVFTLSLLLPHVTQLEFVADRKILKIVLTRRRAVFNARLD